MTIHRAAALGLLSTLYVACLPTDTRNPPGTLAVSASSDSALTDGFTSDDGWTLRYSRFLVVLGDIQIEGDDCDMYNEGGYSRILDMTRSTPQKVALLYGLGPCQFTFRINTPRWNTILGEGVTENDETFLRTAGSDAHANGTGISVQIEGSAQKDELRETFAWSFRRFIEYDHCFTADTGSPDVGITLSPEQELAVNLLVRGNALFREAPTSESPLFAPFAAADAAGDNDGSISLEELQNSPLDNPSEDPPIRTLGDRVYLQQLPEIARFQNNGTCHVLTGAKRRNSDD